MHHVAAFAQSVDPAGAFSAITAVREEILFTSTVDLRIRAPLTNIVAKAVLINDASAVRAQFQAPSLRSFVNLDVEPFEVAATFGDPPAVLVHPDAPQALVDDEALNLFVESNPAAAAFHAGLIWLSDGPVQKVGGPIFSIRATSVVQQVATAWVNGNLTLSQVLPAGEYQVVGLRTRSADAIASRLVFPDQVARPGTFAVTGIGSDDQGYFRYGNFGVFGQFPNTVPPTIDILGGVAAAQTHVLDLIRVR